MVNLRNRFAEKKNEGLSTLVPYVTSGFPSAEASVDVLHTLENSGGDVLELGIPFSDPVADGPTIQEATFKALQTGMTVEGTLEILTTFQSYSLFSTTL